MKFIGYCFFISAVLTTDASFAAQKKSATTKTAGRLATTKKPVPNLTVKLTPRMPSKQVAKQTFSKGAARMPASHLSNSKLSKKNNSPARSSPSRLPARQPASQPDFARQPSGMAGLGLATGAMGASKALEIRGQARTLSMMLILRNGKENVNFVKVRQDYATEIANTEF